VGVAGDMCSGKQSGVKKFWWGNLKERSRLKNLRVNGMIILKKTFKDNIGIWFS
jgi:hypothetical protein